MRIYAAETRQFQEDVVHNRIVDKLTAAYFEYYGRHPGPSEKASWNNSLQFLLNAIEHRVLWDNYLLLEYELPYASNRIDCLLFGSDRDSKRHVVLVELKQWSEAQGCEMDGNVKTFVGGANRIVPHPSLQVRAYRSFLEDFISLFSESPEVGLHAAAYCHNLPRNGAECLLSERLQPILQECPLFTKDDFQQFGDYLQERLANGAGLELFGRFAKSPIGPSKRLMDHTASMIGGQKIFHLIDDQLAANNAIIDRAKKCARAKTKCVILVRGGPGTGKSVIALNAMAELNRIGCKAIHATGSKTFTSILHKILGTRASKQFRFFNNFMPYKTPENDLDVLICDESHRIRESSNTFRTPKARRSTTSQIEELVRAARLTVFFIDDLQIVRGGEVGSTALIQTAAADVGAELYEFELTTQFRCNGSDGYLSWLNNTLEIGPPGVKVLEKRHKVDFRIFADPQQLYDVIRRKHESKPNSARLVAGFCWPWSKPNPDGTLVKDVTIGNFSMPWEGKDPADTNIALAHGIPPWYLWGHDPNGINQIGCIYTVQGLEFDYVGVIFGNDITFDSVTQTWKLNRENSCDPYLLKQGGDLLRFFKSTYRVLMSRGMKGCYAYFVDKSTEAFFRSRVSPDVLG